ncbi:MAG: gliding motility-associated C-terminal domain-containing protein [Flavobacteriales bacterium]|nr:gliding motility-associated C-terminal domain-containing protein [Flavobacteriales bacterium]
MKVWEPSSYRLSVGLVVLLTATCIPALAQPVCSITIDPDQTICQGQSVLLNGPSGYSNYLWSTGSGNQNINVNTAGTYWCQVSYPSPQLVTNGNFTAGNTGFTSQFTYNSTLTTDGNYWIATNAALYHPQFSGTGNGNFMMVNSGWPSALFLVWCQDVVVCPGQTYTLSYRARSLSNGTPARLQWWIDGAIVGPEVNMPAFGTGWQTITQTWTTGPGQTAANICLKAMSGDGIGNDIGLDDISMLGTIVLRDSVNVNVTPLPAFDLGPATTLCTGQSTTLDASVAGGSYLWQDASTNSSFNVTAPGNYSVTVTANNCSATDNVQVSYNPVPVVDLGPDQTLCTGQSTTLVATLPGATYTWQDGSTASTFNVSGPGTYSVGVLLNGCFSSDAVDIAYNTTPTPNLGPDLTFCAGDQATLDATTPGATYLWNDGSGGPTLTVNASGTYDVDVTVNGCTGTDAMNVSVTPLPVVDIGPDQIVCPGTAITLDATLPGGTYLWSGGSSGPTLTTSTPGNISVLVTVNGCSNADDMTLGNYVLPVFDLGADQTICAGASASFSVNVAGATYSWNTGANGSSIQPSTAGVYWVDVTTNGCIVRDSAEVFVTPLPVVSLGNDFSVCPGITATLDASTAGATYLWSSGAVTPMISATPGPYSVQVTVNGCSSSDAINIGGYPAASVDLGGDVTLCLGDDLLLNVAQPGASYLWQDGSSASTYLIQSGGPVTVQLTDANGCVANDAITATYAAPIAVDLGPDASICMGDQLTLDATIAGATYLWNTGAQTPTIDVSTSGTYTVVVTQGSCTVSDAIDVSTVATPIVDLGPDQTLCTGDVILLDATAAGVSYLWNTGAQTATISVAQGGTYSVTLSNVAGCTATDAINVIEATPDAIDLGADIVLCQGQSVLLDGTLPGATYDWSTGASSATITASTTGIYWVEATQGLCSVSDTINITVQPVPTVDLGNDLTLCAGDVVTLDATFPGATYAWNIGVSSPTITVSNAGTYSVLVDLNGCTATDELDVAVLSLSSLDLGPDVTLCDGETVTFDATMPGVSFLWSTGEQTATITTDVAGTYWVEASQGGCAVSDTVGVIVNPVPSVDLGSDLTLCAGDDITLDATNVGATYAWSNGANTPTITVSTASTYSVTVDLNGCTASDAIDIAVLSLNALDLGADVTLCDGETVTFDATMPGVSYLWSTGEQTPAITTDITGTYWVTASQGACSVSDTVDVIVNPVPIVDLGNDLTLCAGDDLTLDATNIGATYAWSNGSVTPTITVSAAASYAVTVTLNGCTATDQVDIDVLVPGTFDLGPDVQLCSGDQVVFALGIAGASYDWSTGETSSSISVNTTSTVWVNVTQGVCSASDTVEVFVLDPGSIDLGDDITACAGTPVLLDATAPNATYLWNTGATSAQLDVTTSGTYSVVATIAQCTATDQINVTIVPLPVVDIGGDQSICPGNTASFDATTPGASYLWHDGSTSSTYATSTDEPVTVTVTINGCSATDGSQAIVLPAPSVDFGNDTTICEGASLLLDATNIGASYLWSNGSLAGSQLVSVAGTYAVTVDLNGCTATDAITVDVFVPSSLDLGVDQLLCPGEVVTLATGISGQHTWSTGSSSTSITVSTGGTYSVQVQVAACIVQDNVTIAYVPLTAPELADVLTICEGDTALLHVDAGMADVVWSTGSTNDSILVDTEDDYSVTLSLQGCTATDQIRVNVLERVDSISLGTDSIYCPDQPLVLDVTVPRAQYEWSTGATTSSITIDQAGTYSLHVTGQCINAEASLEVIEGECDPFVYVPNTFTPNGDGNNEFFQVSFQGPLRDFSLYIFDRWGERIFTSDDPSTTWDGSYNGEPVPDGVYVWKVRYRSSTDQGAVSKELIGHVTVLR